MKNKVTFITIILIGTMLFCGYVKNGSHQTKQREDIENTYNEEFSFDKLKEGDFENYSIHNEIYTFSNDKSSSASISYPSVSSNNKELDNKVNESIKKAAFYNYHEEEILNEYNANIIVDYTIVHHSDDRISIFFNGECIKGSFERGLSISLKDGTIENFESFGINKAELLESLKTKKIDVNNIEFIDYLEKNDNYIPYYLYDRYINYNDEECNLFVDDNNVYMVITLAPANGYGITLKIPYELN